MAITGSSFSFHPTCPIERLTAKYGSDNSGGFEVSCIPVLTACCATRLNKTHSLFIPKLCYLIITKSIVFIHGVVAFIICGRSVSYHPFKTNLPGQHSIMSPCHRFKCDILMANNSVLRNFIFHCPSPIILHMKDICMNVYGRCGEMHQICSKPKNYRQISPTQFIFVWLFVPVPETQY